MICFGDDCDVPLTGTKTKWCSNACKQRGWHQKKASDLEYVENEKIKAIERRAGYYNDPEWKARLDEANAAYRSECRKDPEWRKNKTAMAIASYARRSQDPGFIERRKVRKRKRLQREAAGDLTTAQWMAKLADYGWSCAYCSASYEEMDHVTPISRGGAHTIDNVVPACLPCNRRKSTKPIDTWYAELIPAAA